MTSWVRFRSIAGSIGRGILQGEGIAVHSGEMFESPQPSGLAVGIGEVTLLSPCQPSKIVALWNNFHALAAKLGTPAPQHPLYLIKPGTSVSGPAATIERPLNYGGKIAFE